MLMYWANAMSEKMIRYVIMQWNYEYNSELIQTVSKWKLKYFRQTAATNKGAKYINPIDS